MMTEKSIKEKLNKIICELVINYEEIKNQKKKDFIDSKILETRITLQKEISEIAYELLELEECLFYLDPILFRYMDQSKPAQKKS